MENFDRSLIRHFLRVYGARKSVQMVLDRMDDDCGEGYLERLRSKFQSAQPEITTPSCYAERDQDNFTELLAMFDTGGGAVELSDTEDKPDSLTI